MFGVGTQVLAMLESGGHVTEEEQQQAFRLVVQDNAEGLQALLSAEGGGAAADKPIRRTPPNGHHTRSKMP